MNVNRFGEMEVFVQVHDRGGFSAAARALGMTPSAVSKLIARLEARLSIRLFGRSTRKLALTSEGKDFYDHCVRLLADLDEAERSVAGGGAPRGRVSINTSVSFGNQVVLPLVPRLLALYPALTVDLALTDRVVDLIEAQADIAIRWGPLPPSNLVARRLGHTRQVIVASPDYLARHGTPQGVDDLRDHVKLAFSYRRRWPDWPLRVDGRIVEVPVQGPVRASSGEVLRQLAVQGVGLVRLSTYHVQADLDAGRLVPVLEHLNPGDTAPLHAVYLGRPDRLPARVRAVLDFLVAETSRDPRLLDRPEAPA